MDQISLMNLFETGTHRGNSRSKLNPRLRSKVYGFSSGLCVIDLVKTIESVETVSNFLFKLGEQRKQLLIVGTSDHIKETVPRYAGSFDSGQMPYVNNRWLGGTLTNWSTIKKTLKTLEKLEDILNNTEFYNSLTRNEQLNLQKEKFRVSRFFDGLKVLRNNRPGAVVILDGANNPIAVKEAELMKVPVVLLTNTSVKTLPNDISKTVVCNIYSVNTVEFITKYMINAYNLGYKKGAENKIKQISDKKTPSTTN